LKYRAKNPKFQAQQTPSDLPMNKQARQKSPALVPVLRSYGCPLYASCVGFESGKKIM